MGGVCGSGAGQSESTSTSTDNGIAGTHNPARIEAHPGRQRAPTCAMERRDRHTGEYGGDDQHLQREVSTIATQPAAAAVSPHGGRRSWACRTDPLSIAHLHRTSSLEP
nr:hypothetical protein JVH1_3784 [Rhodococcus sp. JVH1]